MVRRLRLPQDLLICWDRKKAEGLQTKDAKTEQVKYLRCPTYVFYKDKGKPSLWPPTFFYLDPKSRLLSSAVLPSVDTTLINQSLFM